MLDLAAAKLGLDHRRIARHLAWRAARALAALVAHHVALGERDEAFRWLEEARKTLYSTNVFGLAGRIAHDRKAYDTAQPLLEKAIELSAENCSAAWFLGLVHTVQERWLAGAATFEGAERCYRGEIELTRAEQRAAAALETDADVRATRAAEAEATIRTAERQAALAAYNAAFASVRGGEPGRAKIHPSPRTCTRPSGGGPGQFARSACEIGPIFMFAGRL